MEYIIVKVAGKADGLFDVVVNGELSGKKTGDKIILGKSGYVNIAAASSGMKNKTVKVENSTISHPMMVELTESIS